MSNVLFTTSVTHPVTNTRIVFIFQCYFKAVRYNVFPVYYSKLVYPPLFCPVRISNLTPSIASIDGYAETETVSPVIAKKLTNTYTRSYLCGTPSKHVNTVSPVAGFSEVLSVD